MAREYAPRIRAVAYRLVGNHADADDVTQEVLLKLVRSLDTFRGESALSSWLHSVTAFTARDYRRRHARHTRRASADALDGHPAGECPTVSTLSREAAGRFAAAVAGLPAVYRDAFVLADVEGLSHAAVAERLGVHPATVKTRAFRARGLLRDALAPYYHASAS